MITFAIQIILFSVLWQCQGQPAFPALNKIVPSVSNDVQAQAVEELIKRKTPTWSSNFQVQINASLGPMYKDTFKIETLPNGKLSITGTSGVAAAMGYYYYLSQNCNCHISWAGDQLNLPQTMPQVKSPGITVTTNDRFRYYQNVCTVSYSFAWWNWTRWEREIDWMAMSGINMPLAFNGQEAIWQRVYSKMGFSDDVLGKHFGGPAFLAWARMGNMHGWGGPLTSNWHADQVKLQHMILDRMRAFGMTPVLPAFAGHVPENFQTVFPKANVSKLGNWGSFNATYCCTTLLEVTDQMFPQIGKAFVEEYVKEFGTNHLYNTDTFNEMTPRSGDSSYLTAAGKAVYQGLTSGDPDAVWVMQGWLFQSGFWTPTRAKALLTSVPLGRMIVLDLYAEVSPKYQAFESYYGQPFIWCMLHNFGGTVAMYGALDSVNQGPFNARKFPNSTMIGTGLTPEGINQNNVVYEFMNEHAWRTQPRDITGWMVNYSTRRYGMANNYAANAWKLLQTSVYNCKAYYKDHGRKVIVNTRPKLKHPLSPYNNVYSAHGGENQAYTIVTSLPNMGVLPPSLYSCNTGYSDFGFDLIMSRLPRFGITPAVWYNPEAVYEAWDNMVAAAPQLGNMTLFRYDYVDVARQSIQIMSIKYYNDVISAYNNKDMQGLRESGGQLTELFEDLEVLLASDPHFLLGRWIADAKALAHNEAESKMYEFNARNQVTLWGPTGQILDYANKQWSGMVKGYYVKRWELFVLQLQIALVKNVSFDQNQYNADVFQYVELPFQTESVEYPTEPQGDTIKIAEQIHSKYRPLTKKYRKYFENLINTNMPVKEDSFEPWSYKYNSEYKEPLKPVKSHLPKSFKQVHVQSFEQNNIDIL